MTRHDRRHFDWFVANGFFSPAGGKGYELTERGRAAADLGLYDREPAAPAATPTKPKKRT